MGWDDYPSALEDPEIRALMQRIDVHIDAVCEAEYPRTYPGRIELTMKYGSVWRESIKTPPGEPGTMLSTDEPFVALRFSGGADEPVCTCRREIVTVPAIGPQATRLVRLHPSRIEPTSRPHAVHAGQLPDWPEGPRRSSA